MARGSKRTSKRARQPELELRSWGGRRKGAGRKRSGPRPKVPHRTRPWHDRHHPLHVTMRLREGLPGLHQEGTRAVLERAFGAGAARFGFRLIEHSIQSNHVHLVAEARDRRALWRGMQGLKVRIARALNRHWGRKGTVFADRYHARALGTPREVRAALVYVLHNGRRHGQRYRGVDPYSSGPWFLDWAENPPRETRPGPGVRARTWLLRVGWRRHGLIGVGEAPGRGPP